MESWEFKNRDLTHCKLLPTPSSILKQNTKLMFEFLHDFGVIYQTVCFYFPLEVPGALLIITGNFFLHPLVSSTLPGTRWHLHILVGKKEVEEEMKEG